MHEDIIKNSVLKAFFLLSLFLPVFLTAQKYPPFPERVTLAYIAPSKPVQERNENEFKEPFVSNFHPIGWSNDGKAAFLTWSEGEFSASMGVMIYDAVNDSIVDSWFDDFGDDSRLTIDQVRLLWKSDKDSVLPMLKQFHIVADTNALYSDFPLTYANRKGEKSIGMEYGTHKSAIDDRFEDSLFLDCLVYQNEKMDSIKLRVGGFYDVDIFPAGLWMSPDRKFSLIAIVYETGGQHGTDTPHNIDFRFQAIKLPD